MRVPVWSGCVEVPLVGRRLLFYLYLRWQEKSKKAFQPLLRRALIQFMKAALHDLIPPQRPTPPHAMTLGIRFQHLL